MNSLSVKFVWKKYWMFVIFFTNCTLSIFSQSSEFKYYKNSFVMVPRTDSLYDSGEYRKSIKYNLKKIDSTGQLCKVNAYILAQDYALLEIEDSAFYYLNYYIDSINPSDYRSVYVDQDFELLRKKEREWNKILKRIDDLYLLELDSSMNKEVALKLFRLEIEDQKYGAFAYISCRRGDWISAQESVYRQIKHKKELVKIIKKHGFPTPSKVGYTASLGAFYALQHSIIENKYYYMAKEAFEKGDYIPECYALLTDRWLQQNNKTQIYGTQFTYKRTSDDTMSIPTLDPVGDFKNLNKRRADLKLPSIEEYAKRLKGHIPEEYYNQD